MRLYLVRHGRAAVPTAACVGWSDPPLADPAATAAAMRALARRIEQADVVLTSDLRRAGDTASPLGRALGAPVRPLRSLREMHFGAWEGLSWDAITERDPEGARRYFAAWRTARVPEGESVERLWRRVERAWRHLPAGRLVVVAHGGSLRALAALATGRPLDELMARPWGCGHACTIDAAGRLAAWDLNPLA